MLFVGLLVGDQWEECTIPAGWREHFALVTTKQNVPQWPATFCDPQDFCHISGSTISLNLLGRNSVTGFTWHFYVQKMSAES